MGSSGPDTTTAVALRFDNYDQDVGDVFSLAEIDVRDAYGDAIHHGSGNMRIRTFRGVSGDAEPDMSVGCCLTLKHDGFVGVNTEQPQAMLDVAGSAQCQTLTVNRINFPDGSAQTKAPFVSGDSITCFPLTSAPVQAGSEWTEVSTVMVSAADAPPMSALAFLYSSIGACTLTLRAVNLNDNAELGTQSATVSAGSSARITLPISHDTVVFDGAGYAVVSAQARVEPSGANVQDAQCKITVISALF